MTAIVLRTPQKWECSIGGLASTYDFSTGVTTAVIINHAFDIDQLHVRRAPILRRFLRQIEAHPSKWAHPLFLPSVFLATHARYVRNYITLNLNKRTVLVERLIGITKAGQPRELRDLISAQEDQRCLFKEGRLQRNNAQVLTQEINDLSTWTIFTKRSPQWDIECTEFLLKLLDDTRRLDDYRGVLAPAFRETLEYVRSYSRTCAEITQTTEARLKLQLNILYTAIAQDDGRTMARLAASTGKDSTSMKIIALITAAYLPSTFVATLFSMDMFNWQSGSEMSSSSVSSHFWIYWAVSIPLTIITLAGWGMWWSIEKRRWEQEVHAAMQ